MLVQIIQIVFILFFCFSVLFSFLSVFFITFCIVSLVESFFLEIFFSETCFYDSILFYWNIRLNDGFQVKNVRICMIATIFDRIR